jgi:hypothetical protein
MYTPNFSLSERYEVLIAVVMKGSTFRNIMLCSRLKFNRRFEGPACYVLYASLLLGLFVYREDGDDIFLRNVG